MLHREPMGRKAYRFSLHELGVMVLRMDANMKITVLHKAKVCITSSVDLVIWSQFTEQKTQQTFVEKINECDFS